MRTSTLLAAMLVLGCHAAFAQHGHVRRYEAPLCGTTVLRDADDKYNAAVFNLEAPEEDGDYENEQLREIKEQVAERYPRRVTTMRNKQTATVPKPVVSIGFIADSLSGIPPDNHCAVSNGNKAVSVMNQSIAIHDATTGAYVARKSLSAFSAAVGLTGINHYRFDPKVIYDPEADKFICVILNSTNQYNWVVLGFSKTNDPNGAWNFYKLYGDYAGDTTWFDYPAISVTKKDFFLTGNKIRYSASWQLGFTQTLIYQVKKESGYRGDSLLQYQIWDSVAHNGRNLRCLHPVMPSDGLSTGEQYFLSNRNFDLTNDTIFLVRVPDTLGSGNTGLTVTPLISNYPYGVPPNGRQPDTSKVLATNDGRVLGGFIHDNEIQFVSVTANAANGAASIYHGIISNVHGTPSCIGKLVSVDTLDLGYPNISYTGNAGGISQSIISFEYTGPHKFPGYGAVFFDGSDHSAMLDIKSGTGSVNMLSGAEQRWGDYSGSHTDWDAIGAVWVEGIFGRTDQRYGNYMARLASPYYNEAPESKAKVAQQSKLYPQPAWEYVHFEFNVEQEQAFTFVILDMTGRVVDKVLETKCRKGRNLIQFNVQSLPTGTYLLQAIGNEGEKIAVHKLIRQ